MLTYFGAVVILQSVLGAITGETSSPLATVISTLGIAAVFNPLRRRVQEFIDRRFFRSSYDAEQVLARFGDVARDEVDLDRLMDTVFGVVEETLRPVRLSSWLKQPDRKPRETPR